MKIKVSKLVRIGYIDRKFFYGIHQLNANGEKSSTDETEATMYCDELADKIFDYG